MDDFRYQPLHLEDRSFRLLQLHKGALGPIECDLFHAHFDAAEGVVEYEALSYTWGGNRMPKEIEINGKKVPVTENLYLALWHLRSVSQDRILWIDALCIDQDNEKERGHQVRQMASIYKKAERVLIWLGGATEETDLVLSYISLFEERLLDHACNDWEATDPRWHEHWFSVQPIPWDSPPDLTRRQQTGLITLLNRPWFKRVWIIQEVVNARAAQVVCGSKTVSARIFSIVSPLIGITPDRHCQAIFDIMPGPTRRRSWSTSERSLHTLLRKFQASQASDSRDHVYALLGISSDGSTSETLVPDYEISEVEVVQKTVSFLLQLHDCGGLTQWFPRWNMRTLFSQLNSLGNEMLILAADRGPELMVETLLQRANITLVGIDAALQAAVAGGRKHVVELLLDKGADINERDVVYGTALHAAAANGQKQIVELLLEKGAHIKERDGAYGNALCAAVLNGHKQIVELLLEKGAVIDSTTLRVASSWKRRDIRKLLLEKGVDVHGTGEMFGATLQAAEDRGHEQVVEPLPENDADINERDGLYTGQLRNSAAIGNKRGVELLLEKGADINGRDGAYGNALFAAVLNGDKQLVELLLEKGADVNVRDQHHRTAIYAAIQRGDDKRMVELLLEKGAEINVDVGDFRTVLQAASYWGRGDIVRLLLEKGANVNAPGGRFGTALEAAGHDEAIVALLLEHGANTTASGSGD